VTTDPDLDALERVVSEQRRSLDRQFGRAEQVARSGKAEEAEVARLRALADIQLSTATVLTSIGEEAQETARAQVEALATRALQVIFGSHLSFHLVPGERAGQVTLEFEVWSDYGGVVTKTSVLDAHGGGMAQVVGFVLQLVVLLLTPDARRVMFLDEAFAWVSESYAPAVAAFLQEVAEKAGVQIFLSTHSTVYSRYADKRYRLVLSSDGVTQVQEDESE
jgi:DNA repair ATPase RecN